MIAWTVAAARLVDKKGIHALHETRGPSQDDLARLEGSVYPHAVPAMGTGAPRLSREDLALAVDGLGRT